MLARREIKHLSLLNGEGKLRCLSPLLLPCSTWWEDATGPTTTRDHQHLDQEAQFQAGPIPVPANHGGAAPGRRTWPVWAWPSPCSAYETPAVLGELGSSTTLDMPDDVASLFLKPENNVYLNHFCLFLMTAFLNCYLAIHAQIFHFIQEFKCSVYGKYHGCPSLCIQTGEKENPFLPDTCQVVVELRQHR